MELEWVRTKELRHGGSVTSAAGFTLIELMIVLAVVAILSTIAYPSFAAYVLRANRAAAQGLMTDLASRQHQFFLDTRGYGASVAALRSSVPDDVAAKYDVAVTTQLGPPPGFVISAVPRAGQAADVCGTLSIDAAGVKAPATCW
ncbi:MAG: type IV pilin protein [Lautropia sp.]